MLPACWRIKNLARIPVFRVRRLLGEVAGTACGYDVSNTISSSLVDCDEVICSQLAFTSTVSAFVVKFRKPLTLFFSRPLDCVNRSLFCSAPRSFYCSFCSTFRSFTISFVCFVYAIAVCSVILLSEVGVLCFKFLISEFGVFSFPLLRFFWPFIRRDTRLISSTLNTHVRAQCSHALPVAKVMQINTKQSEDVFFVVKLQLRVRTPRVNERFLSPPKVSGVLAFEASAALDKPNAFSVAIIVACGTKIAQCVLSKVKLYLWVSTSWKYFINFCSLSSLTLSVFFFPAFQASPIRIPKALA